MSDVGLLAAPRRCGMCVPEETTKMMIYRLATVALLALTSSMAAVGCSADAAPNGSSKNANGGEDPLGGPDNGDNTEQPKPGEEPGPPSTGPLGVVTIDVQQVFFNTATSRNAKNVAGRMDMTARVFDLAKAKQIPLFLTFEASKSGDHALPAALSAKVPPHTQEFIKTTFGAMGLPSFASAIQTSGVRRVLALGAETDVCVMQTLLGLRRSGVEVLAMKEGLFTEEVNDGPAWRRLRQAGVVEISVTDAEALLESGGTTPTRAPSGAAAGPPVIVQPLAMGFVLHGLEGLNAADPNASAKMVRLRELLLVSEWFKIPLLAENPQAATQALPQNLKSIVTRPIVALANRPASVKQLAVAGGHVGISAAVATLKQGGTDVFVVEDALLGGASADLEPLYVSGAIPTTYKGLYYELTVSVSDAQWPSQQWVKDGDKYFNLTKAPEELPQLIP